MICPRCGAYMVDSNNKCWKCGYVINNESETSPRIPEFKNKPAAKSGINTNKTIFAVVIISFFLLITTAQSLLASSYYKSSDSQIPKDKAADHFKYLDFSSISSITKYGVCSIHGNVTNSDTKEHNIMIIVYLYDKNKNNIGYAEGIILNLKPNEKRTFKAVAMPFFQNVNSYKVETYKELD